MARVQSRKTRRPKLLSHSRPQSVQQKSRGVLSSRATRTVIRSHHQLQKALSSATAAGDTIQASAIEAEIEKQGGLKTYQIASITGQKSERGGDSSRILMTWLHPINEQWLLNGKRLRLLEVGALSTDNACSRSRLFETTRIDLHAQTAGIQKQDFMRRPLPKTAEDRFDILSLSLVLNYVPDPSARGDMLRRSGSFLRPTTREHDSQSVNHFFPSLFLVLPAPCLNNSRYLDEERLTVMMASLGYVMVRRKLSAKLIYYLWRYNSAAVADTSVFPKTEINPGSKRNNFAVVLS